MQWSTWWTVGVPVLAMVAGIASSACGKGGPSITPASDNGADAATCTPDPGQFPPPTMCPPIPGICPNANTCPIDPVCGNKATCLPMADNTGKSTIDLRIRRLTVVAPSALASHFIQQGVVDQGITLNEKQCGELGDGAFNWLLRIDKTARTLKTGGAPPTADPFGIGYCFANATAAGSCIHVTSINAPVSLNGNTFSSTPVDKLNVPIFVGGDRSSLIILPISYVAVKDVTFSADGNCIGAFNYGALDGNCNDSRDDCDRWTTAGSLAGYITLEEADTVPIPQLGGKTLCVMLTGQAPGPDMLHCKRDANDKIAYPGDYCSQTKMPGGCADSYWMAATFAASAIKIDDASSDPLCNGAVTGDAGAGSCSPGDAGSSD